VKGEFLTDPPELDVGLRADGLEPIVLGLESLEGGPLQHQRRGLSARFDPLVDVPEVARHPRRRETPEPVGDLAPHLHLLERPLGGAPPRDVHLAVLEQRQRQPLVGRYGREQPVGDRQPVQPRQVAVAAPPGQPTEPRQGVPLRTADDESRRLQLPEGLIHRRPGDAEFVAYVPLGQGPVRKRLQQRDRFRRTSANAAVSRSASVIAGYVDVVVQRTPHSGVSPLETCPRTRNSWRRVT
jgi:hypothetical protein